MMSNDDYREYGGVITHWWRFGHKFILKNYFIYLFMLGKSTAQ